MTTPIVPQKPINKAIYDAISEACFVHVGDLPKTQQLFARRDELIEQIKNKVPHSVSNDLSDLPMNLATQYGDEMLRLGIELGRNPGMIFDLPDNGGEA